jgi:hypothetical protein
VPGGRVNASCSLVGELIDRGCLVGLDAVEEFPAEGGSDGDVTDRGEASRLRCGTRELAAPRTFQTSCLISKLEIKFVFCSNISKLLAFSVTSNFRVQLRRRITSGSASICLSTTASGYVTRTNATTRTLSKQL